MSIVCFFKSKNNEICFDSQYFVNETVLIFNCVEYFHITAKLMYINLLLLQYM